MTKIWLLILLVLTVPKEMFPQGAPALNNQYSFTAAASTASTNIIGRGISYWIIKSVTHDGSLPSACTAVLQTSSDNVTWATGISLDCSTNTESALTQINTAYVRVNVSTLTRVNNSITTINILGYVESPIGSNNLPTVIGVQNSSNTTSNIQSPAKIGLTTSAGDGSLSTGLIISNGTNFDVVRSAGAASGTTGTGLFGSGTMVRDTNWQYWQTPGINGDANNGSTIGSVGSYLYNGVTYDRARGGTDSAVLTGVQRVNQAAFSFSHIATNATTTSKSGAGVLHSITVNTKGITNTLTCYDNTAASGTVIAILDTTLTQDTLVYDLYFATGLTCVTAGGTAADITVTWR